MITRLLAALGIAAMLAVALAGCGRKGDLEPPPSSPQNDERQSTQTDDG